MLPCPTTCTYNLQPPVFPPATYPYVCSAHHYVSESSPPIQNLQTPAQGHDRIDQVKPIVSSLADSCAWSASDCQ